MNTMQTLETKSRQQITPPREKNRECPFLRIFGYCPCLLGELMTFSVNKRCNEEIGRVLYNQELKLLSKVKNRKSLKFIFIFSQLCKNGLSLFYP